MRLKRKTLNHKESVIHTEEFYTPASSVWNLLIDWKSIIDWMPDGYIRSLVIHGEGTGVVRHLVTGEGVAISERLDEMDEERGILKLSIIDPLPWGMLSYTAEAQLDHLGRDRCG